MQRSTEVEMGSCTVCLIFPRSYVSFPQVDSHRWIEWPCTEPSRVPGPSSDRDNPAELAPNNLSKFLRAPLNSERARAWLFINLVARCFSRFELLIRQQRAE